MSTCRICAKLRRWLGLEPELSCDALWRSHWDQSDAWERAHSNEDELWWRDSDRNRRLIEEAYSREDADAGAAFQLYLEAAEAGSPWALEAIASHYYAGRVVAADFERAADHYRRAIDAGSWMATISYARLLDAHGHVDEAEALLLDGVRRDFIPAYFWLACLRYDRNPTRATCRAIRPLLEYAGGQGHPGAKQTLGRLMAKGKLGLLAIPKGLRLLRQTMPPILRHDAAADRRKGLALEAAAQQ